MSRTLNAGSAAAGRSSRAWEVAGYDPEKDRELGYFCLRMDSQRRDLRMAITWGKG